MPSKKEDLAETQRVKPHDPLATQRISKEQLAEVLERTRPEEHRTSSGVRTKAARPFVPEAQSVDPFVASSAPMMPEPPPAPMPQPPTKRHRETTVSPRLLVATLIVGLALGVLIAIAFGLVR